MKRSQRKPSILVSSVNYGVEDLLEQIYAILSGFGYRVWMSYKGTMPVKHGLTALDNCLAAVRECDLFLGLITGRYGSGKINNSKSITHREVELAVSLGKPRWFLCHRNVTIARELLKQFRFDEHGNPLALAFKPTKIIDDIRVLEMYEAAIRSDRPDYDERIDNWVHPYTSPREALLFVEAQFQDVTVFDGGHTVSASGTSEGAANV